MGRTDTHSGQTAALQRCRDFGHPGRQIQPGRYQMTLHPSLNDTNQISGGKSLQRKIDDFFFFEDKTYCSRRSQQADILKCERIRGVCRT